VTRRKMDWDKAKRRRAAEQPPSYAERRVRDAEELARANEGLDKVLHEIEREAAIRERVARRNR
jgi:hypothetical protein